MSGSEFSEKRSEASEFCSESRKAGGRSMSSVAAAKSITREIADMIAPSEGWQRQVSKVHAKLIDPKFEWRIEHLTWSRVKSWFYGEARRVDYDEMVALQELRAIEEATREHRQFAQTTTRLAALLAAEGQALSRAQVETLTRIASRQAAVSGDCDAGPRGEIFRMAGAGTSGEAR